MHFLTCTDEKKWKIGKRTAEKDGLVGATYCAAIFPPEKQLLQSQVDPECERFVAFVTSMDSAVKVLFAMSSEQTRRFQLQWKKDFQRVGDSFSELAKALKRDESTAVVLSDGSGGNQPLSTSVGQAAAVFIQLGQRFGDQPKLDWIPFCDRLHIYRGILSVWPDALAVQRAGIQKRKECERLAGDQKMGNVQLQEVNRRTDINDVWRTGRNDAFPTGTRYASEGNDAESDCRTGGVLSGGGAKVAGSSAVFRVAIELRREEIVELYAH